LAAGNFIREKPRHESRESTQILFDKGIKTKHGYWATKYDASAVKSQKILRRQFGRSYDVKKVRNKYEAGKLFGGLVE